MNVRKMSKGELELLSYTKIAEEILKLDGHPITTADLFGEVCKLLDIGEKEYQEQIADFFEALTTAKEFILLDDGHWDLKVNHSVKIDIDDIYEEEEDEAEEEIEEEEIESDEEILEDNYDDVEDDDYSEEELGDLSIVSEEELEE